MENNLRLLMAKYRVTLEDIHKTTGLSKTTISKISRCETKSPDLITLLKLCDYFKVTLNDLIPIKTQKAVLQHDLKK